MHTLRNGVAQQLEVWHDTAPLIVPSIALRCVFTPQGLPSAAPVYLHPTMRVAYNATVLGMAFVEIPALPSEASTMQAGHYVMRIQSLINGDWVNVYSEVIRIRP